MIIRIESYSAACIDCMITYHVWGSYRRSAICPTVFIEVHILSNGEVAPNWLSISAFLLPPDFNTFIKAYWMLLVPSNVPTPETVASKLIQRKWGMTVN